jgi:hypothetical protein
MRKFAFALSALGLVVAAPAMAASLVFDTFSYPNGPLVPNGGWANYSGVGTDIQVAAGAATGGAIGNPANDDHILFAPQALTAVTYACFDVTIPTPPAAGQPKAIYFAELKDGGAANLVSRVYVLPLATGGWTFGLSHSSTSATVGVVPWTAPLAYDTRYHLVINYDPNNRSSTLWVNATVESDPSVSIANATVAPLAVSGFGLRQSNGASTLPPSPAYVGTVDWNFIVDNLGVGSSFSDACEIPTPVETSSWGRIKGVYR